MLKVLNVSIFSNNENVFTESLNKCNTEQILHSFKMSCTFSQFSPQQVSGSGGLISFPPECRPSGEVSRQEGPAGSQGQITVNYPRQITSAGRKFVAANLLYFLSLSGGWWWTIEKPSSSSTSSFGGWSPVEPLRRSQ